MGTDGNPFRWRRGFQPRKVERSGIFEAVEGTCSSEYHKEEALMMLSGVTQRALMSVEEEWAPDPPSRRLGNSHVTSNIFCEGQTGPPEETLSADVRRPDGRAHRRLLHDDVLFARGPVRFKFSGGNNMKVNELLQNLVRVLARRTLRQLPTRGTLIRYIDEPSVTGPLRTDDLRPRRLKQQPTNWPSGKNWMRANPERSCSSWHLRIYVVVDLFRPTDRTNGVTVWRPSEVSPPLGV